MLGIGGINMNKTILISKEFTIASVGDTNIFKGCTATWDE